LLTISAITSRSLNIKQPSFQDAYTSKIETYFYKKIVKICRGYLGLDEWVQSVKPCKVDNGKEKRPIFIEIIKIYSRTTQVLGPNKLLAALAAWGSFKKRYPPTNSTSYCEN